MNLKLVHKEFDARLMIELPVAVSVIAPTLTALSKVGWELDDDAAGVGEPETPACELCGVPLAPDIEHDCASPQEKL